MVQCRRKNFKNMYCNLNLLTQVLQKKHFTVSFGCLFTSSLKKHFMKNQKALIGAWKNSFCLQCLPLIQWLKAKGLMKHGPCPPSAVVTVPGHSRRWAAGVGARGRPGSGDLRRSGTSPRWPAGRRWPAARPGRWWAAPSRSGSWGTWAGAAGGARWRRWRRSAARSPDSSCRRCASRAAPSGPRRDRSTPNTSDPPPGHPSPALPCEQMALIYKDVSGLYSEREDEWPHISLFQMYV